MQYLTEKRPEPGNIRHVYLVTHKWPIPVGHIVRAVCGNERVVGQNTFTGAMPNGCHVCYPCFKAKHAHIWRRDRNPEPFYHPMAVDPVTREPAFKRS